MNTKNTNSQHSEEDDIDLIALAKTLWECRKTVIKTTVVFMIIGLLIAILAPKEYTASTTLLPQTSEPKVGGSLGGLAAMAGINLGGLSSDSGISPMLYPQIISSIPFQKQLLHTKLNIEGQTKPITFKKYFLDIYNPGILATLKKYTLGLPIILIKAIKGNPEINTSVDDGILRFSNDEKELFEILSANLIIDVNDTDGFVTISTKMPEPVAAAQITLKAQQLLEKTIIDLKTQKSNEQLKFLQERFNEKEIEFKQAQQKLANLRDRNFNLTTARGQTLLDRYQAEYDLAYGVYSELAKQLEAQRLLVKEDTPIFTVLKPVVVPIEKSAPNRPLILIVWTMFGIILGFAVVLSKKILLPLKDNWNRQ